MSQAWRKAQKSLAGGVNSPVRAFKAVGGEPVFISRGQGSKIFDINDKSYIDYCMSWGAMLMGHAEKDVVKAIQAQAAKGTSFGTATENETHLAELIKKAYPSIQKMRFTSSGTEAVMSAIRLARGVTGREKILKFDGCYHGHSDSLLVRAGSGLATLGIPDSGGVPACLAALTATLPYNDAGAVRDFFRREKSIACVIVEPIAGNMGVVPAKPDFLEALRKETTKSGALLIFDEVINGFRVAYGGAQSLYGIRPDITVLGKIIGGGLPVGSFGASKSIMDVLAPTGTVYQAGTLSGNPVSMAAGISVLSRMTPDFYKKLGAKSDGFLKEAKRILKTHRPDSAIQSVGSMFTIFFGKSSIVDFAAAKGCDASFFARFFHAMLDAGVYIPPSLFESYFISSAHSATDLEKTLKIFDKTLRQI